MAQSTTYFSGSGFYAAVSTDGSSWSSIEGSINKIDVGEQNRMNAVAYTPDTDTGVITYAKLEPVEITVTCLYTKTSGESWARIASTFYASGGTRLDFRYAPEGNSSGNTQFTTQSAKVISVQWPNVDAGSAGPAVFTAKWIGYLTPSTI